MHEACRVVCFRKMSKVCGRVFEACSKVCEACKMACQSQMFSKLCEACSKGCDECSKGCEACQGVRLSARFRTCSQLCEVKQSSHEGMRVL